LWPTEVKSPSERKISEEERREFGRDAEIKAERSFAVVLDLDGEGAVAAPSYEPPVWAVPDAEAAEEGEPRVDFRELRQGRAVIEKRIQVKVQSIQGRGAGALRAERRRMMSKGMVLKCCLMLALLGAGCAKVAVKPVTGDPSKEPGIYYALPETVITIEIPVKVTKSKPGKGVGMSDAELAPARIRSDQIQKAEETKAKIEVDQVEFGARPIPDLSRIYYVKAAPGILDDMGLNFTLQESGVISEGLGETKNLAVDFAVRVAETALTIAGKTGTAAIVKDKGKQPTVTAKSKDTAGAGLVNDIVAIRKQRGNLIATASKHPESNAETVKLLLANLDAREQKALSALIGPSETAVMKIEAEFTPGTEADNVTLFRVIVNSDGNQKVCPAEGNTKASVFIPEDLSDESCGAPGVKIESLYALRIEPPKTRMKSKIGEPDSTASKGNSSFFYRIPEQALVTLTKCGGDPGDKAVTLAQTRPMVAQIGAVTCLPAQTGGVYLKYDLKYHEQTGALKTAAIKSSPISLETVDMARKAFETYKDAEAAKKKAEAEVEAAEEQKAAAASDEVNQLKREAEILQLKKTIQDLNNSLNPTPVSP
jgi:hypothetical protein